MSTDPTLPAEAESSTATTRMENGNAEASTSNSNGTCNTSATRMKVDGLAVTMDGKEEEADMQPGKPSEEQQDAAAQDLNERRQSQLRKQNRFTKTSVLIPPENFAIVEEGLYRSVSSSTFPMRPVCLFTREDLTLHGFTGPAYRTQLPILATTRSTKSDMVGA